MFALTAKSPGEWGNQTTLSSRKTVCKDGVGWQYAYSTVDCSGTPQMVNISEAFDSNTTVFCDGESCPYVVVRSIFNKSFAVYILYISHNFSAL